MAQLQFGRIQMRIMQVLWKKKQATAREITEALNVFEPVTHSTVQTLLRALDEKGAVSHDVDYRTFVYYPLVNDKKVMKSATRDFLDRIFAGSAGGLVSYLFNNEFINKKELTEIIKLLDEEDT